MLQEMNQIVVFLIAGDKVFDLPAICNFREFHFYLPLVYNLALVFPEKLYYHRCAFAILIRLYDLKAVWRFLRICERVSVKANNFIFGSGSFLSIFKQEFI